MIAYLRNHFHGEEVEIVTGMAKDGPDDMAYHFARWDVGLPYKEFPADWDLYGKSAGFIRNGTMAEYGTHLIVFWDGKSSGSKDMLKRAKEKGLKTTVIILDPTDINGDYELYHFPGER
jgi:hypothetical protein